MSRNTLLGSFLLVMLLGAGLSRGQTFDVGLSPVRAEVFHNEDLLIFQPAPYDYFGIALAAGDFDGDGVDDLATGIQGDDGMSGAGILDCGAAVVRYGVAGSGLAGGYADDFLSQVYGASPDPAEPGDGYGAALAAGDFNGDGIDDLALGAPRDIDSTIGVPRGGVGIHYGSGAGIQLAAGHYFEQGRLGIPDPAPQFFGAEFGAALASGDFDGDGYDDLAIGSPRQRLQYDCAETVGRPQAPSGGCGIPSGSVLVSGGGPSGLLPFHGFYMFEGDQGLPDDMEDGDEFGRAIAAGDFDGDGYDDLAIGVPQEDGVGAVLVVFGSPFSLIFADHVFLGEFDLGQAGELDDQFGRSLAVGDFDADGYDDLAIGTPYEDLFTGLDRIDAGAVTLLYGAAAGFDLSRKLYFDQRFDDPVDVGSLSYEVFGWALAVGDFDGDGADDLAVGHHRENGVGGLDSGAVTAVMGSPALGLRLDRRRQLQPGLLGVPGASNAESYFGYALAGGDFDADGHADLAVGSPIEDFANVEGAGTETVLYGSLFSDGFEAGNMAAWSDTIPGP